MDHSLITDDELDAYRVSGRKVRVVRDGDASNDVRGIVVAWNDETVMIRRPNRRVVKLDRRYLYMPADEPRPDGI